MLITAVLLVCFGLVMMTSASVEIAQNQHGDALYYFKRQLRFLVMGLAAAAVVVSCPVDYWRRGGTFLFLAACMLLALVFLPGIGREVNGSARWLNLGFMSVQASEPAKLFIVAFTARCLSTDGNVVHKGWLGLTGFLLLILVPVCLLLREPDFGAAVVVTATVGGMLFLAGIKLHRLGFIALLAGGAGAALILSSPYRAARLEAFLRALTDPFSEEVVYGTGYQLAQSLIAFGRGEWTGVGLGNSIQKLYFLPEAHTDFVLAIIAEELGFLAVLTLLGLFAVLTLRAFQIAWRNEKRGNTFAAYTGYGIALLFTGQSLVNVAVNVGLLPTKGLTLPFLSYGGSSLIVSLVMVALLLRMDMENRFSPDAARHGEIEVARV